MMRSDKVCEKDNIQQFQLVFQLSHGTDNVVRNSNPPYGHKSETGTIFGRRVNRTKKEKRKDIMLSKISQTDLLSRLPCRQKIFDLRIHNCPGLKQRKSMRTSTSPNPNMY